MLKFNSIVINAWPFYSLYSFIPPHPIPPLFIYSTVLVSVLFWVPCKVASWLKASPGEIRYPYHTNVGTMLNAPLFSSLSLYLYFLCQHYIFNSYCRSLYSSLYTLIILLLSICSLHSILRVVAHYKLSICFLLYDTQGYKVPDGK